MLIDYQSRCCPDENDARAINVHRPAHFTGNAPELKHAYKTLPTKAAWRRFEGHHD